MYIEEEEAIEDDALAYDLNEEDDADLVDKDVIEKNFSTFIIQKYGWHSFKFTQLLERIKEAAKTDSTEVIPCPREIDEHNEEDDDDIVFLEDDEYDAENGFERINEFTINLGTGVMFNMKFPSLLV